MEIKLKINIFTILHFLDIYSMNHIEKKNQELIEELNYNIKIGSYDNAFFILNDPEININARSGTENINAVINVAIYNQPDILRLLLLRQDLDINAIDAFGDTALIRASMLGYKEIVKILLSDNRLNINLKDFDGDTALSVASLCGRKEIVKMLLNHPKIDINLKDKKDQSALDKAIKEDHSEIVKLLLTNKEIIFNLEKIKIYLLSNKVKNI